MTDIQAEDIAESLSRIANCQQALVEMAAEQLQLNRKLVESTLKQQTFLNQELKAARDDIAKVAP